MGKRSDFFDDSMLKEIEALRRENELLRGSVDEKTAALTCQLALIAELEGEISRLNEENSEIFELKNEIERLERGGHEWREYH